MSRGAGSVRVDSGGVLVRSASDLDPRWAERIVRAHCQDARVSALKSLSVETGTTTRVAIAVDHDGPEELARRWFVKLPSASWKARAITALPRLPQMEVRFYRELAHEVPIPHPRALAAASAFGRGHTLVLGDVRETGATPSRPGQALRADEAMRVVEALARLHARFFEAPAFDDVLSWLSGPVRRLEAALGSALAVPLMRRGLRRAGSVVPAHLHAGALRYAKSRRRVARFLDRGPRTLVHHDCHPGNLYWTDGEPGLLDWQLVRVGEGVGDVAYLLATALEPETRREAAPGLLQRYAEGLAAAGAPAPDAAVLERRYRAHTTYAFEAMVVTLAVGGLMPDPVVLELVRRTAAAVADARGFEALVEA